MGSSPLPGSFFMGASFLFQSQLEKNVGDSNSPFIFNEAISSCSSKPREQLVWMRVDDFFLNVGFFFPRE